MATATKTAAETAEPEPIEPETETEPTEDDPTEIDPGESGTDAKAGVVLFRAKGVNFRSVRTGANRTTAPNGEVVSTRGISYDFAPTGEYRTADPDVIAWLRNLPSFNLEFWEVGAEPGAVASPEVVLEQVMHATAELHVERLREILAEEMVGHKRDLVLKTVRAALAKIEAGVKP